MEEKIDKVLGKGSSSRLDAPLSFVPANWPTSCEEMGSELRMTKGAALFLASLRQLLFVSRSTPSFSLSE